MRHQPWPALVVTLLVACAGKSTGSSEADGGAGASKLGPCNPFAAITTSVQLDASSVVAAGQAEDGSIYVVYDDDRLFVGSGKKLVEQLVVGSGETSNQTDLDYTDEDGTPVVVEVVRDSSGVHMAVARGTQNGKGIDGGSGEQLTPVEATLVAKLTASTTHEFDFDFAAHLPDGRELVVIKPAHEVVYEKFRVFFGPAAAIAEQVVTSFGSSGSGQRYATIMIDGAAADLTYLAGGPSELNPAGGPSTLTIAGTATALIEGGLPTDSTYLCLSD